MTDGRRLPGVTGVVTLFYYRDLPAARTWYDSRLGFECTMDLEGVVMYRIVEHGHLALVAGDFGSQRPIDGTNKGAMISLQTDDLDTWHRRLVDVRGAGNGIVVGAGGRTREFKVYDPEGYSIEFFEWIV